MTPILEELDREWSELATSPRARRALIRWSNSHAALVGQHDLADVMRARRKAADAPGLLLALAALAPDDELAARTLLQVLLPGLVCMSSATASDDPAAMEEMVSLAWERIRTYPTTRHGSVAANVLLDVRKRYRKHRLIEAPTGSLQIDGEPADDGWMAPGNPGGSGVACSRVSVEMQGGAPYAARSGYSTEATPGEAMDGWRPRPHNGGAGRCSAIGGPGPRAG